MMVKNIIQFLDKIKVFGLALASLIRRTAYSHRKLPLAVLVSAVIFLAANGASMAEVLNYTLNENIGMIAMNHSGNGNNGIMVGETWAAGIDEIRISNATLTANQIRNNYNNTSSPHTLKLKYHKSNEGNNYNNTSSPISMPTPMSPLMSPSTSTLTSTSNWIVGSGGNNWSGNSSLDNTYQNTNKNIELDFQSTYVDQSNVITPNNYDVIYIDQWVGQSFTANTTGLFKALNATIYKNGNPSDNLIISLYNTSGGDTPVGLPLIIQNFSVSDVSSQNGWHLYNFSQPYKLIAGYKYAVVVSSYYTYNGIDYYKWDLNTSNTYPSGVLIGSYDQGGSWGTNSQWDNPFEIVIGNRYDVGNLTTWHNASNGNVIYKWAVNISLPANTSWSASAYDNQTGAYIETLANHSTASGYQEFTTTQIMDYKVNLTLFGDINGSPEVINEIFFSRAINGTTPAIISSGNNQTNDNSLSLQIPKSATILFNVTANQSMTNWHWGNATIQSGNGTANSSATRQFTDAGVYYVSVYGENSNGTTDIRTWTITVMANIEKTILILDTGNTTNNQNYFAEYFEELLKLEGFNDYQKESIEYINSTILSNAKIVILPQIYLSKANEDMIINYVNNGGSLIADRPSVDMSSLFGLSPQGSTISDQYLKIDNTTVIGKGLTNATMRFRGTADNYNIVSGTTIAWLYSDYSTNSTYPAIHYATKGSGRTIIYTLSLRNDIINFTQGNASQASNLIPDIDGDGVYRASDLFYNWNNASLTDIPQADVQVNTLSNSIMELMRYNRPIARLWYFPNETLALNVWTGDGDGANYTLVDLETSDVHKYGKGNMSFYSLGLQWTLQEGNMITSNGSGLSYHFWSNSLTPTIDYYSSYYAQNKIDFYNQYGFYGKTARHHYVVYVGWAEGAQIEANNLIQMDLNYIGVNSNVGRRYMTGSGLPIRFVDANGNVLDIYNQPAIFEDDLELRNTDVSTALQEHKDALNNSINMYHTAITAVFHPYNWYNIPDVRNSWGIPYLNYSLANNVYTWSAENWNDFTRAREKATISVNSWNGQVYNFTISGTQPADISQPFTLLLPASFNGTGLSYIKRDGVYYPNRTIALEGVSYTIINTTLGTHTFEVSYSGSSPKFTAPNITRFNPPTSTVVNNIEGTQTFNITINQTVNVDWFINGTKVFSQSGVTLSSYTNNSAVPGTWNVTAIASNANGTDMHEWDWIVTTPVQAGAPNITSATPVSPITTTVGAAQTFSIIINQSVNVTWLINGTIVQDNEKNVATASYINTSAAAGTWNVTAIASNDNGTVSQTWNWNATQASTSLTVASAIGTFSDITILHATLTSGGSPVSGKSISFTLNGVGAGTDTTNATGMASVSASLAGITAGTYSTGVGANFAGDMNYTGNSSTAQLTVNKATATVKLSNLDQIYTGSPLIPTATTNPPGLNIVWAGAPQTSAGSYPVIAAIDDANYTGNASGTFNITKASTSTVITSSVNPSTFGEAVNFTATVSSTAGTPTGTVQFNIDGSDFGSPVTLSGGMAKSRDDSSLSVGSHMVMAVYSGNTNFSTNSSELTQTVNRVPPSLASINVTPSTATLPAGGYQTFNATALDQYGNPIAGINISWTVSNSSVGNVTPLFAITGSDGNASTTFNALAAGSTMVNASNGSVTGSAIVTVTTPPPPPSVLTKIIVSSSTASLTEGGNQPFNATALDQNNKPMSGINISWTVSNSTVGSITPLFAITGVDGNVSATFNALAPGNSMVNATNGSITGSASVTVSSVPPHLTSIIVSPSTASLIVGGKKRTTNQKFNATALDQNNNPMSGINISWTVSNSTVGSVTPLFAITGTDGNVSTTFTALVRGTAMITASNGSVNGSAIVTVTKPAPQPAVLTSIVVSPSTASLAVGGNQKFNATALDQNNNPISWINISWIVSNSTVESVTPLFAITGSDGIASATFTASAAGITMVNATNGSVNGSAIVTVTKLTPTLTDSISGYKINDANGNGRWDAGEKGLSGWTIQLMGIGGTKETITNEAGFYILDNLPAGRYLIKEENKRGFVPTSSPVKVIMLTQGENSTNNFTNRPIR